MASQGASLLEIERDRLQGALNHLERSVTELKVAIAETGPDLDYKEAINDNVVLIAKYRARIEALEDEIRQSKGIKGNNISRSQLAAVPIDEDGVSMQQPEQRRSSIAPPAAAHPQQQHGVQQPNSAASTAALETDSSEPNTAPATVMQGTPGQPGGMWL